MRGRGKRREEGLIILRIAIIRDGIPPYYLAAQSHRMHARRKERRALIHIVVGHVLHSEKDRIVENQQAQADHHESYRHAEDET